MRKHRTTVVVSAAMSLAAAALGVGAGTAAAEPAGQGAQHCTLDTATSARQCFADYTQAIAQASHGRITTAPADARAATRDPALRTQLAAQPKGDVIQGTFFDGTDYTGDSLTVSGPDLCVKDGVINWQLDLGDDWKNKVSSVQPWGNCWIWLYPETGLNGDRDGPFKENTGNIGAFMDNRTQSIGFS
jgi:hypothetical protein